MHSRFSLLGLSCNGMSAQPRKWTLLASRVFALVRADLRSRVTAHCSGSLRSWHVSLMSLGSNWKWAMPKRSLPQQDLWPVSVLCHRRSKYANVLTPHKAHRTCKPHALEHDVTTPPPPPPPNPPPLHKQQFDPDQTTRDIDHRRHHHHHHHHNNINIKSVLGSSVWCT